MHEVKNHGSYSKATCSFQWVWIRLLVNKHQKVERPSHALPVLPSQHWSCQKLSEEQKSTTVQRYFQKRAATFTLKLYIIITFGEQEKKMYSNQIFREKNQKCQLQSKKSSLKWAKESEGYLKATPTNPTLHAPSRSLGLSPVLKDSGYIFSVQDYCYMRQQIYKFIPG